MSRFACRALGGCLLLLVCTMARSADDFPVPYNSETDTTQTLMSAADAAAALNVPDAFEVTVFASEPDVQNPIAMNWDARGRLWVAENYTYAERTQRFDLSLRDRVLIFADTDGDGVADRRTVFTDSVQMLTSVEVGHGGVWLMCPPQLLFIPDADGDDTPDGPAQVVLDGFDVANDNYHNFANGLRFGPDGWLYGRCGGSCPGRIGRPGTPDHQRFALEGGIWRYHPVHGDYEVLMPGRPILGDMTGTKWASCSLSTRSTATCGIRSPVHIICVPSRSTPTRGSIRCSTCMLTTGISTPAGLGKTRDTAPPTPSVAGTRTAAR